MTTAPFLSSDTKRPASLSFSSGAASASSAQSPLLPFLSRNFITPSPNGRVKRKADGEVMDEEVQSPAKQFYVDWEFQEHVMEGGYFRDSNLVSTSKWEGDTKAAEDSKMEEEDEGEWLPLSQISSVPFFGLSPLTPGGFNPKVGKRRLPDSSAPPATEGATSSEHHQFFGPPGFHQP